MPRRARCSGFNVFTGALAIVDVEGGDVDRAANAGAAGAHAAVGVSRLAVAPAHDGRGHIW